MPETRNNRPDGTPYRRWTTVENGELVDLAVAGGLLLCPVCCYQVMSHQLRTSRHSAHIKLHCENCGNFGGEPRHAAAVNSIRKIQNVKKSVSDAA